MFQKAKVRIIFIIDNVMLKVALLTACKPIFEVTTRTINVADTVLYKWVLVLQANNQITQ